MGDQGDRGQEPRPVEGGSLSERLARADAGPHSARSPRDQLGGPEPEPHGVRWGVIGALVATLAVLGVGGWAAWGFFSSAASPATAFPADTVAYAGLSYPAGTDAVEAYSFLQRFPAVKEKLGALQDWPSALLEQAQQDGQCRDVDPGSLSWVGRNIAVGMVPQPSGEPAPVVALEVTDPDAASAGLDELTSCLFSVGEHVGFVMGDGYALIAEKEQQAQAAVDGVADGSLAADAGYQRWVTEAGGEGIVTAYASPDLGSLVSALVRQQGGDALPPELSRQVDQAYADFTGGAATIRVSSSSIAIDSAAGGLGGAATMPLDPGTDAGSLPSDTAAAIALNPGDGWLEPFVRQMSQSVPGLKRQLATLGRRTGIEVPEDVEAALGDSFALSAPGSFLSDAMATSEVGDFALGLRLQDSHRKALKKILAVAGGVGPLTVKREGDVVAVSPSRRYADALATGAGLGGEVAFTDAVAHADEASLVVFVDADADDWLVKLLRANDVEASDLANAEPLHALGVSAWQDGDVARASVRLTLD